MAAAKQTTTTIKKLMDGRLRLERRNNCQTIYMRTFAQGKDRVKSTGETSLAKAIPLAEEWWHDMRRRVRSGENIEAPTFAKAAEEFLDKGLREHSASQVKNFKDKWSVLRPYFGDIKVANVDKAFLLDLRADRSTSKNLNGEPLKPATLKKDMLFVRLVLRYAKDYTKSISQLPDFPSFTRNSKWEIVPKGRPRFTRREYFHLLKTAIRRAREPGLNPRTQRQREELVYFIVIVTGAALRVGEAYSIRWQDCDVYDGSKGKSVQDFTVDMHSQLAFKVVGKHSKGEPEEARGNRSAFRAYLRLVVADQPSAKELAGGKPNEKLFRFQHRDSFRDLLEAAGLRRGADGRMRNLKSLRPTGISFKLDGPHRPSYSDVAKWTRTSMAMIEKYYDQRPSAEAMDRVMRIPEPQNDWRGNDWEGEPVRQRTLSQVKRIVRNR